MPDTYMFEVYYKGPIDELREARISSIVARCGGRLDFHEGSDAGPIILTYEFLSLKALTAAATELRAAGEHVEGGGTYAAD